jgi:hypothetical protein
VEDKKFDAFTQALVGSSVSRKQLLQRFAGGFVGLAAATLIPDRVWAAGGGNSSCAHFCDTLFGDDTPAADACISAAAHHMGLCSACATGGTCAAFPACGPTGSGCICGTSSEGLFLCFTPRSCIDAGACTTSADCPSGQLCLPNTCCGTPTCGLPCTALTGAPLAATAIGSGLTQAG